MSFIAFGFGVGLIKKAPGTFGSLLGFIIFLIFYNCGLSLKLIFDIDMFFLLIGIFICNYAEIELQKKDYKGIVWDEISSMILVLCFTPINYLYFGISFLLFRSFDILKPWPIKIIDKNISGGLGIMLDDVLAALFSILFIKIILLI